MRDQNNSDINPEDREKRERESVRSRRSSNSIDKRQKHLIDDDDYNRMCNEIKLTTIVNLTKNDRSFLAFVLQSMSLSVHIKDNDSISTTPPSTIMLCVVSRQTNSMNSLFSINNYLHQSRSNKLM